MKLNKFLQEFGSRKLSQGFTREDVKLFGKLKDKAVAKNIDLDDLELFVRLIQK